MRVWFNFFDVHANCAGCCDASEYVRNAKALNTLLHFPAEFWNKFFLCAFGAAPTADQEAVRSAMSFLKEVYGGSDISDIFAGFIRCVWFCIFGSEPGSTGPGAIYPFGCSLRNDCVLCRSSVGQKVGYVAGAIAALYPGFIVNSGRLYTESFATFLVCVLLAFVVRGFFDPTGAMRRAFALGLLGAGLQLTRSIMVIFSVSLVPILFMQERPAKVRTIAALLLGFACVIVPWVSLQHIAFGKGGIVVDRVGNYNLFIGTNTNTQGWLTFPYPDGRGIEQKSLTSLLTESYKVSPNRFLRLMLDKPARLFQLPWNDFRTPIGGFDFGAQALFHQIILLTAGLGVMLALFTASISQIPTRPQLYSRLLLVGFAGLHLIYAIFITVPRYGLTAMPGIIAFAAAGLVFLVRIIIDPKRRLAGIGLAISSVVLLFSLRLNLVQPVMDLALVGGAQRALFLQCAIKLCLLLIWLAAVWASFANTSGYRRLSGAVTMLALVILVPILIFPGRAGGRWYEWQRDLRDQNAIRQSIQLPKPQAAGQSYLLIDADGAKALRDVEMTVNGRALLGPVIPGMALVQDYKNLKHQDNGKVYWEAEYIFNCMTKPAETSNADLRQWFLVPIPKDITTNASAGLQVVLHKNVPSSGVIFGSYRTHDGSTSVPSLSLYSWEKAFYSPENDRGLADSRLDERLSLPASGASEPNIRVLIPSSHDSESVASLKRVRLADVALSPQKNNSAAEIETLPPYKSGDLWLIRATGDIKAENGTSRPSIDIGAILGKGDVRYESPWAPHLLPNSKLWQHFDFCVPLAPSEMPGGIKQLRTTFNLNTSYWKSEIPIVDRDSVQFRNVQLDIMKMPSNPLLSGYSIY